MEIMSREVRAAGTRFSGSALLLAMAVLFGAHAPAPAQETGSVASAMVRGSPQGTSRVTSPGTGVTALDSPSAREGLLAYLEEKRRVILHSLRKMPEDRYDEQFVSGQRTFGQQARHVAEMNYAVCSAIADDPPPTPGTGHDSPENRLVAQMRRSFEYCRSVIAEHGDSVLYGAFETPGGDALEKAKMLFFLLGNWADHYGHFATYLRMSGLEPPDTWSLPADILSATTRR